MKKNNKTKTKISWPIAIVVILFFITLSTFSLAQQINTPRYRLTLESENKAGWWGAISNAFQNLKMSAIGVINPKPGEKLMVMAVAYSPTVDQNDASPCITASGTVVRKGVVATNFLPIGTRLKIGDSTYVVEDRMNSKYNGKKIIDIWHPTTEEALSFGSQKLEIEILPKKGDVTPISTPAPTPEQIAEKPTNLWQSTQMTVKSIGDFFAKNVQTRTYGPEADCSKVVGKTLK